MKKRIALFTESFGGYGGGGAQRVMVVLANAFFSLGYEVDFILKSGKGVYKKELLPGINLIVLFKNSQNFLTKNLQVLKSLYSYFRNKPPDVFMATIANSNIQAVIAWLLSGKRTRLFVRVPETFDYFWVRPDFRKNCIFHLTKLLYPRATGIITNSEATKKDVLNNLKVNSDSVFAIYNPLVCPEFGKSRIKLFTKKHTVLVGCGRLEFNKNFSDMIKVFPKVKQRIPNAKMFILGDGPEFDRLKSLIKEMRLDQDVFLTGFVADPYQYFLASDVFLQTSLWEGFGYVLAEAMSCGAPVVAYDAKGAMREILKDGLYGKLTPVGDLDAFANAIIEQIKNPTSSGLLLKAVERFSVEKISSEYLKVFGF